MYGVNSINICNFKMSILYLQYIHLNPLTTDLVVQTPIHIMSKNKPSTSVTHVACDSKPHAVGRSSMHPHQETRWLLGVWLCIMPRLLVHLVQKLIVDILHTPHIQIKRGSYYWLRILLILCSGNIWHLVKLKYSLSITAYSMFRKIFGIWLN